MLPDPLAVTSWREVGAHEELGARGLTLNAETLMAQQVTHLPTVRSGPPALPSLPGCISYDLPAIGHVGIACRWLSIC